MTKASLFALALFSALPMAATAAPMGVVYFTEWSALLDPAATSAVGTIAKDITGKTGQVTVTGYADTVGSTEANDLMSKLRAQMVIDQLKTDGVPATRLTRADKGATPDIGGLNESRRVMISIEGD